MKYELKKLIANHSLLFMVLYIVVCAAFLCIATLPHSGAKKAYLDSFYQTEEAQISDERALREKTAAAEYGEFLENAKLQKQFLFANDTFSMEQEQRTREAYSGLNDVEINAQPAWGLENLLHSKWLFLVVLGWILIVCTILIHQDKERIIFLRSTGVSDWKLPMQKNGIILLSAFLFYAILYWSCIFIHYWWIPFDWSASVQSFAFLRTCSFSIDIGVYLCFYFAVSALVYAGVACWCIRFYSWFSSSFFCIGTLLLFLVTEFFLKSFLFPQSIFSTFYWVNLWSILDIAGYTADVLYINLLGGCVSYWAIWGAFLVLSFLILVCPLRYPLHHFKKIMIERKKRLRPHGQMYYELKKIWFLDGLIYCLPASIILLLLSVVFISPITNYSDQMLNRFIDDIGSYVSESADLRIQEWETRYADWEREYEKETDLYRKQELEATLSTRIYFEEYRSVYNSRKSSDPGLMIPKESQYRLFYMRTLCSTVFLLLQLFVSVYISTGSFFFDRQRKIKVLHELISDRKRFTKGKTGSVLLSLLLSQGILWITWWSIVYYIVGAVDLSVPVCALQIFEGAWRIPVGCWQIFSMIVSVFFWCILCVLLKKAYSVFPKRIWAVFLVFLILACGLFVLDVFLADIWQMLAVHGPLLLLAEILVVLFLPVCKHIRKKYRRSNDTTALKA